MLIRQIVFSFILFLVALPAAASAQVSMIVLGLNSVEGDDDLARDLTDALRRHAMEVPTWRTSDLNPSSLQMELAHNCTLYDADCRDQVLRTLGTGSMIYGQMMRVMGVDGTDYEVVVRIFRYDALETRIIAAGEVHLTRFSTPEQLDAAAERTIRTLASGDPPLRASSVPVDEDETDVDLSVHPEPSTPDPVSVPAPASYNHEWAGWSLIGLGAALLIADIPVWLRLNDLNGDPDLIDYRHRLAFGATGDACSNASAGNPLMVDGLDPATASAQVSRVRGMCSEGAALEALQYVFLALGAASAGTGALLLATGVLVTPSVSTDHATLTVSGSF
jgi:hypothetical protein